MGALSLPAAGVVYVDAQIIIYSVEARTGYVEQLQPLWEAAKAGTFDVVTSTLSLLEVMVRPLRDGDTRLQAAYREALGGTDVRLLAVTEAVLLHAADLRAATPSLRTPDAVHAATALGAGVALFVSNDKGFRQVAGLPLALLEEPPGG